MYSEFKALPLTRICVPTLDLAVSVSELFLKLYISIEITHLLNITARFIIAALIQNVTCAHSIVPDS